MQLSRLRIVNLLKSSTTPCSGWQADKQQAGAPPDGKSGRPAEDIWRKRKISNVERTAVRL
eukprot:11159863-Alexandrium_andersonii.AAC.1